MFSSMTMTINIPEQVLLIKITRLGDHLGATTGFVLMFYDVTQVMSQEAPATAELPAPVNLRLNRIPMVANQLLRRWRVEDHRCRTGSRHDR